MNNVGDIWRRWRLTLTAILALLCLVPSSCDLEDDRDDCCANNKIVFRYTLDGEDCFDDYISSMRYFLFDEDGTYLMEMEPDDGDLSQLCLCDGIPSGTYSLVAVGNLVDYASLENYEDYGLENFLLVADDWYDDTDILGDNLKPLSNGDRLYWGQCDFTLDRSKTQTFYTEMANIHCKLTIRVEWEGTPDYSDGYSFALYKIGSYSEMNDDNATQIGVQTFPLVPDYSACMVQDVALSRAVLLDNLYTLRLTDDNIPTFCLMHSDEAVTMDIDLTDAFEEWNWTPSSEQVQEYVISLKILTNGNVEASSGLETNVNDWTDGGTIY